MMIDAMIEFAVIIALPLYLLTEAGKRLDASTGHHFFVIIGILAALALSAAMIGVRINQFRKKLK